MSKKSAETLEKSIFHSSYQETTATECEHHSNARVRIEAGDPMSCTCHDLISWIVVVFVHSRVSNGSVSLFPGADRLATSLFQLCFTLSMIGLLLS